MNLRRKIGDPSAIWYMMPAMVPLTLFWLAPTIYVVYLSFTDWDFMSPVKNFVGLTNYAYLLEDPAFHESIKVTFLFTAGSVIPIMTGGLLLALLLNEKLLGSSVYRAVIFSPWVTPTVAVSMVWSWIFEPRSGFANAVLEALHIGGLPWMRSSDWALISVLIVTIWKGIGWTMVFYLVALQNIPASLREAAALDGAGRLQSFYHVTLSLISPTSFFLFIVLIIESIQAYDQIDVLTQGGPAGATRTILYLYYQAAFERFNVGEASAIALSLIVICAGLSVFSFFISRKKVHYLS